MRKLTKVIIAGLFIMSVLAGCSGTPGNTTTNGATDSGATTNSEQGGKLEAIKSAGKLILGMESHYAPYEFHIMEDGKDKIVGFDVDIAGEIAKDLGVELVIDDMQFDALVPAVQNGNVDIAMAAITPTEERRKSCDFSEIYFLAHQSVIVRAADVDKYTSIDSLKGMAVGGQRGSIQEGIVQDQMTESQLVSLPKVDTLVLELMTGNCEAVVLEDATAQQFVKQYPELAVSSIQVDESDFEGGCAVMLPQGEKALVDAINQTIKRLQDSGEIEAFVIKANEMMADMVPEE